ncbi:hypothetical protein [Propionibacterium phage TCUCAP1]|nr:hypothetical protein [Propionibacterium phage TCUCAP1]
MFGGGEGSKIVVCEVGGFSAGDAFADLEVARPYHERNIAIVGVGVVGWFWGCPFG